MKTPWVITAIAIAFAVGYTTNHFLKPGADAAPAAEPEPLYWVAPMDATFRRDKPGKSPMGMDLIPVYEQPGGSEEPAGTVSISAAVENNLGVKTAPATMAPLSSDINTVGYVQFDEDRLHHVHIRVDGWIETLNISAVGEPVEKDQVLFELYSPTLLNAQKDLISAKKTGGKALLKSAKQRLRLLGMDKRVVDEILASGEARERIGIHAMESGIVSDLQVRHGMYIEPSSEVMAIGSIETVWVIAEVFERQAAWLAAGQKVTMTVDSYPGEEWQAEVDYIYPILNPQSRTLQVRVRVDNPDQRLKRNMFSSLLIHTRASEAVLSVPRSAVIRGGREPRVVLALGDGRYRSTAVRLGREAGERIEILDGLSAGELVVTSAQFLIDSESNIEAESTRMGAGSSMEKIPMSGVSMDKATMDAADMDAADMDAAGMDASEMEGHQHD